MTASVSSQLSNGVRTKGLEVVGSVRQAAEAAADVYTSNEMEKHANALIDAWKTQLKAQSRAYVNEAMRLHREGPQIAEPNLPTYPIYPYWGLFMAGPFQPMGGADGPFMPNKIIRAGDPAFMLYALWRNPGSVGWISPGPSACELMGGWQAQVYMRTGNLTTWTAGPSYGPYNVKFGNYPSCAEFGYVPLTLSTPPNGQPDLYEINTTVDIVGPGEVSFAGFATWAFDPDYDPFLPFLGTGGHWQHEVPTRFMVYTK